MDWFAPLADWAAVSLAPFLDGLAASTRTIVLRLRILVVEC